MVQYIHTPWRERAELLKVRHQFYPAPPSPTNTTITTARATATPDDEAVAVADKRHAVSRVAMWVQRGSCPHMVESTGLLTAAILDDLHEEPSGNKNGSTSALRLAYSAAFSR